MSEAGSSTPSRKRSKWEVDAQDEDEDVPQPVLKRRAKAPRHGRTSELAVQDDERQSSAAPTVPRARPSHSLFVPPRTHHPPIIPSRSVYNYERLNSIEEGSYGVVFRAKDKQTGDIVALKKLKLDEEKQGFPITALREINALMAARHENVVRIREVVVGDTLTQYVAPFT